MLNWMRGPVLGVLMLVLLIGNTIFWGVPAMLVIVVKILMPTARLRAQVTEVVVLLAETWSKVNTAVARALMGTTYENQVPLGLNPRGQYLACSNHQSWTDIFMLMQALVGKAPYFKFFLKQQLIWVPILGMAWWGLDYPFMKRYTKEQISKNPRLKGKDLETTRKACERFRSSPVLVLNFLEGTRWTPAKHARQASPYRHLLKPKSGGLSYAISAFGDKFQSLLDITIVYPDGRSSLWDFLCGRVPRVIVQVHEIEIPRDIIDGDYENDPEARARVHRWVGGIWEAKDRRISDILAQHSGTGLGHRLAASH